MIISRRNILMSTLFGAGYIGLRALATGIPAGVLMKGTRAFADTAACPAKTKAQYFILQTSSLGDPINANCPGTYAATGPVATIAHNMDPTMVETPMKLAGQATTAAMPWATLPQSVLDRTQFWHIQTN